MLSKENTWKIMEYLRRVGARGSSADEISRDLRLPPSIVYSTLKDLLRLEFTFVYPREKRARHERKKRYVCERAIWGKYRVERQFLDALTLAGELSMINGLLKTPLLEAVEKVYLDFLHKKELNSFLPTPSENNICPRCSRSHEAMEFFYATLLKAIDSFITESDEFRNFLTQKGYSR